MNLNDYLSFAQVDLQDRIGAIRRLPDHLESAWETGLTLPLATQQPIQRAVIAGVGTAATCGGLVGAYVARSGSLPVTQHADYDLPGWCAGPETLVLALSPSGDEEEVESALRQAVQAGCQALVLSVPGRTAEQARSLGLPTWMMADPHPTGADLGSALGYSLAALHRLGALADPQRDVREALHALRNQQTTIQPETPVQFNAAKRIAGQLMDRWITVFASESMGAVAKYWKDQLNTQAKAWGQFAVLPEADHNSLMGLVHPEPILSQIVALFLTAPSNHPRNQQRLDLTRQACMIMGINTDFIAAKGEGFLAHMLTLAHFGDYTAYYLAMAYHEDPSQAQMIQDLKEYLREN